MFPLAPHSIPFHEWKTCLYYLNRGRLEYELMVLGGRLKDAQWRRNAWAEGRNMSYYEVALATELIETAYEGTQEVYEEVFGADGAVAYAEVRLRVFDRDIRRLMDRVSVLEGRLQSLNDHIVEAVLCLLDVEPIPPLLILTLL